MQRNNVRTYSYKVGKNTVIVVKITQAATAKSRTGNALAANQADVTILAKKRRNNRV
ncbi:MULTISPECIES: hypothetical protein [Brevibacillus]|jgi:hypothetical protein|uniref:Uncharacterized protein n=1 Tax=Brevibacillus borstelensis AK1 TaxID=1300222 RepID=M8DBK9_9BACL|nr:hypothetical protein [Brevibacillus borstelensis]EMT50798.1 hypothetical protein I532_20836 [Brevibacillus borstelensis AK1]MBE5396709.1 hypothetical protein [Brevibacillus borstelensis]MCC0564447.1 hypothetical protein [Brevibacillus borstelensis]MCM3471199.1 hypothetical protein [Brevibacillus borstelensis]MCM3559673.1 hypothetical protein [Brevibacillus borstelensis]